MGATSRFLATAAVVAIALSAAPQAAFAAPPKRPPPPALVEECGSCHLAYPARFLGRRSWRAVMGELGDHFGSDASLEAARQRELLALLLAGARPSETLAGGKPALRISETSWFRHEHPKPGAEVWSRPGVKSPANCAACHREAEAGNYGERSLRVPKRGAKP